MTDEYFYDPVLAQHLKKVKDRVEWILQNYDSARNNDTVLEFIYMRKFENIQIPFVEWEKIRHISMETISRVRRKFQEQGKYMPTSRYVIEKRKRAEKAFRGTINRVDV